MHRGAKIKELRKLKLWTQAKLAEVAGVSERTVRRLESTGTAESATLQSILKALGTNLEELESMFNDDESIKKESKKKLDNVRYLQRIENGKELVRILSNAHQLGYDYNDCHTHEQVELAQVFLTTVVDVMDIWNMIEIGQRFELECELTEQIKKLEQIGLWVFGDRVINKDINWITAIVEIYSKDNPLIQKVKI
jgi:transcriptional regulator with XRE-family HTH domain